MLQRSATDRAMHEHWGHREFFDTLIVRDVPSRFPPMMAAIMALAVAERHHCQRIIVDVDGVQRDYSIEQVLKARFRALPAGRGFMGEAQPEDREARRQTWLVGAVPSGGASGLPEGAIHG